MHLTGTRHHLDPENIASPRPFSRTGCPVPYRRESATICW
jgi:hypothetical protein